MKKFLLSLFAVLTASVAFGQTNLLTNASFEQWIGDTIPTGWKSASSASNATLEKSTDAHSGTYSVAIAGSTKNMRLASAEIALKPGTYTFSIFVKAAENEAASRIGYVPVNEGKVGSYVYGKNANGNSYPDTIGSNWIQQTMTFELKEKTTICLVVMNSKNFGKTVIADDAVLTTTNGGIDDGTDTPVVTDDVFEAKLTDSKGNWTFEDVTIPEGLTYIWSQSSSYGMKATAYANGTKYATESYLVSPSIILKENSVLSFEHVQRYAAEDPSSQLTLWIRGKEYESWQNQLAIPTYSDGTSWTFVNSGDIDLSAYAGKTIRICFRYTSSEEAAATWEIKNVKITNAKAAEQGPTIKDPSNTPEKAYTIAQAIEIIKNKDQYDMSKEVYTKGVIKSIKSIDVSKYERAQYWITDSLSSDSIQVYNGYYIGGEKFTADDQIKPGDKVIVYGKLTLYGTTYEIDQNNYIYSLNGKTKPEGGDTTVVVSIANTPETAYTTSKAKELIDAGEGLADKVYVKGKITKIGIEGNDGNVKDLPGNSFGNATYFISDGEFELEVYRGYFLNNEKFTAEDQIKVGDDVIVYGQLTKYKETYEFTTGSYIYSLNGTTAIRGIEADKADAIIFDLTGRRVKNATRGLYIINGKKVVVK